MENRVSDRHEMDQPIVYTVFSSHGFNDLFEGEMKNYCDFGMYAELQTHFHSISWEVQKEDASPGSQPDDGM